MKKLLVSLLALLLCLGCAAAFAQEGHGKEDYLGYWKMEEVTLTSGGRVRNVTDESGCVIFHEDGAVIISLEEGAFAGARATYADGSCTITNSNGPVSMVIGTDGKLRFSVTAGDGDVLSLVCVRAECPPLIPAAEPMVGQWEMEYFIYGSAEQEARGVYTLTLYEDGYGLIEGNDSRVLYWLTEKDGTLYGVDNAENYFPFWIDADGKLHVKLSADGMEAEMVLSRVGASEETPVAPAVEEETPAVLPIETPANGANPFLGQWEAGKVTLMGMEFTIEDLGWSEFGLLVEQDVAYLNLDGEKGSCATKYEGDTLVFTSGSLAIRCTIENGVMLLKMDMDGMEVTFHLDRVGGAPAAVETPAEVPAASPAGAETSFLGEWKGVGVALMGMEFTIEELGWSELSLLVEQNVAYLNLDGEKGSCATKYEGDTLIFTDGELAVRCTIENGVMLMKMDMDGLDVTFRLERVGGAPAVVETPAEAPAAVANPFLGQWVGEKVTLMGMEFTIEDLGWSGLSLLVEQDVAYIDLDGGTGSCATKYEGDTLIFTNGELAIRCTIENGVMLMKMDVDGLEATFHLQRVGEAPAAAQTNGGAQAPVAAVGFDGVWTLTIVKKNGQEQSASSLGMSGSLNVMGESARYTLKGDSKLAIVKVKDGVMELVTRDGTGRFTLDAQGRLCRDTLMDGDTVTLIFVREGSEAVEPAAETPAPVEATEPTASECEFCGMEYVGEGNDVEGLTVCDTCFTLFFN